MNDAVPELPELAAPGDDGAATSPDPWAALRRHTPARISLGRAGTSLPTAEVLRFAAAHAQARDAVHWPLDVEALSSGLRALSLDTVAVSSRAASRAQYLARPDLGRQLAPEGRDALDGRACAGLCVVVGDGLSAVAAQAHAVPLVEALRAQGLAIGLAVVAAQARVALGDEIAERVGAPLVLVLLGERPGLSSPDSLGAYLTWAPRVGRVDSERNCVSNIRPEGLAIAAAAARLAWLVRESQRRRVTGIALKDDSEVPAVASDARVALPPAPSA